MRVAFAKVQQVETGWPHGGMVWAVVCGNPGEEVRVGAFRFKGVAQRQAIELNKAAKSWGVHYGDRGGSTRS